MDEHEIMKKWSELAKDNMSKEDHKEMAESYDKLADRYDKLAAEAREHAKAHRAAI